MSQLPPPTPPGGASPPPPPGSAPAPFDPKAANPLDWGIMGAGLLAFLFSFIAYYDGADVEVGGRSGSVETGTYSAWHDVIGGGFFGWFAMVFAIAGAILVALELFAPQVRLPLPARLAGLGLFAAATLLEILALFVTAGDSGSNGVLGGDYDVSLNHGFGYWASLLVIVVGLVLSLMRFQATGGELPGGIGRNVPNVGGYGPQGGIGGGNGSTPADGTEAPPGYGPPR